MQKELIFKKYKSARRYPSTSSGRAQKQYVDFNFLIVGQVIKSALPVDQDDPAKEQELFLSNHFFY